MNTADLTEKIKELLSDCDCNNVKSTPLFTLAHNHKLVLAPHVAEIIAQQLAPEIEKLINQPQAKE